MFYVTTVIRSRCHCHSQCNVLGNCQVSPSEFCLLTNVSPYFVPMPSPCWQDPVALPPHPIAQFSSSSGLLLIPPGYHPSQTLPACLCERFMTNNIYTSIRSPTLATINPHKYTASNTNSILQKYTTDYQDMAENKASFSPHIFQLSNNTYYHMRHAALDQSLIIRYCFLFTPGVVYKHCNFFCSGQTSSGKSKSHPLGHWF